MKNFFTALMLFSVIFYAGCNDQQTQPSLQTVNPDQSQGSLQNTQVTHSPLKIVTSFYPLYEIVHEVGGTYVTITNLVPAGIEPHDYEPTTQDVIKLNQADLVVYNGVGFEPWADKIIPELQKNGVKVLNISDTLQGELLGAIESHEEDHESEEHEHEEEHKNINDPHTWLDPVKYQKEVQAISRILSELDPAHKTEYEQNAQNFLNRLSDLDLAYQDSLKNCKQNSFVTNHAAFAYLANRYQLNMIPISGISPDAEPSLQTMGQLTKTIKEKNIHYILTESLVSPKIAETLASETGAKTLVLNPLEGLTDEEIAQGKNYISVMKDNLKNLQTALECQ